MNQEGTRPIQNDSRLNRIASALIVGIASHWLLLFNAAWGLYVFIPFLAPVFMYLGWTLPATLIYTVYSFLCHQLPDHSYFLFGDVLAPLRPALEAGGMPSGLPLLQERRFVGNELLGYKVALCQRDVAIYGAVFLSGLVYGLVRSRLRPLSFKLYLLFLIPMAIDGVTQMVGLRESTPWLRTITGALFAIGCIWFAYPYVEEAMQDVVATETLRQETAST